MQYYALNIFYVMDFFLIKKFAKQIDWIIMLFGFWKSNKAMKIIIFVHVQDGFQE